MKSNMDRARKAKNDEFYTNYETVEKELINYKAQLENKIIYCNCDDYRVSNFYKYFKDNFESLKLKQLLATNYDIGKGSYKCIYDGKEEKVYRLSGNGDFRSEECIEMLLISDIVITNPPFSLFRDFIATLVEYDKRFLVIGNFNAVTCKGVFPLFQSNKMWIGFSPRSMEFKTPSGEMKSVNASWFTNLEVDKLKGFIPLTKSYYDNIDAYPKYDNYDAIEVSRVKNIPKDYEGVMGVPITFLDRYNPEQFEIVGITDRHNSSGLKTKIYTEKDHKNYSDLNSRSVSINPDGTFKHYYTRFLIKNKKVVK